MVLPLSQRDQGKLGHVQGSAATEVWTMTMIDHNKHGPPSQTQKHKREKMKILLTVALEKSWLDEAQQVPCARGS